MASITLTSVSIDFPIYGISTRSLKKQLLRFSTGGKLSKSENEIVTIRALDNLSLTIEHGDRVGLIGHNGAGKSTLLRVLSRIYEPTIGDINIDGKVTALLDVMLGMDAESTGYENIVLRGILYGLKYQDIIRKQAEIAEFTELGDYLSMPVRTYSSGMQVRLAFGMATSMMPEILILDEVIGAGDAAFIDKAKQRMHHMIHSSDIVVIASHDTAILKDLCTKVLWLDAGKVSFFGDVGRGIELYLGKL